MRHADRWLWLGTAVTWMMLVGYVATLRGHLDFADHAPGRDFIILWTAARMVLAGRAIEVFDPSTFLTTVRALYDSAIPLHFWPYPPTALFVAAPFGTVGYFPALALWMLLGFGALYVASRRFLSGAETALLFASPAVAMNVLTGQNGFFTAAILLVGVAAIDRRSTGGLFGALMALKPHLAVMVPFALAGARQWSVLVAALGVAVAIAVSSVAVFGVDAWRAFVEKALPTQAALMTSGSGPAKLSNVAGFITAQPLGYGTAAVIQLVISGLCGVLVWQMYRRPTRCVDMQAAAFLAAATLAAPQALSYDLIPLAAAALVLRRQAATLRTRLLVAAVWALPWLVILLNAWRMPLAPVILAMFAFQMAYGKAGSSAVTANGSPARG